MESLRVEYRVEITFQPPTPDATPENPTPVAPAPVVSEVSRAAYVRAADIADATAKIVASLSPDTKLVKVTGFSDANADILV